MIKRIRSIFSRSREPSPVPTRTGKRMFAGAASNRLTMDWITAPMSADAAIRNDLKTLRNRSRDLEKNNEWASGFLLRMDAQILGEKGCKLNMRVSDPSGKSDEVANNLIESHWLRWGKVGICTVDGSLSFRDVEGLVLRSMLRDGAIIVRRVYDKSFEYGMRLQLIESDYLDTDYNLQRSQGRNEIRMGVEYDEYRRPVAYHLLTSHPGEMDGIGVVPGSQTRQRIPAQDCRMLYLRKRADESIGYPSLAPAMSALRMLAGYREAELVAARTGAAKMGFFTKASPDGYTQETDEHGNPKSEGLTMDASPGVIEELPVGVDFKAWDPTHPSSEFGNFCKSTLRGVATSQGMSYNTMAGDLESVNYSSIRAGTIDERELFKVTQRFLIEHFHEWVFEGWLLAGMLKGTIALPASKMWKFNQPDFRGRRWSWVDPSKDIGAIKEAVAFGIQSRRAAIAEAGGDIFDVFQEQEDDNALADAHGLSFEAGQTINISAPDNTDNTDTADNADAAAASGDIQQTALNGAQVQALYELAIQVAQGTLPESSAIAIAKAAFPLISDATINAIFSKLQGYAPKPAN